MTLLLDRMGGTLEYTYAKHTQSDISSNCLFSRQRFFKGVILCIGHGHNSNDFSVTTRSFKTFEPGTSRRFFLGSGITA
jgi:hypothetical protein